jgi:hypothetical protein
MKHHQWTERDDALARAYLDELKANDGEVPMNDESDRNSDFGRAMKAALRQSQPDLFEPSMRIWAPLDEDGGHTLQCVPSHDFDRVCDALRRSERFKAYLLKWTTRLQWVAFTGWIVAAVCLGLVLFMQGNR